MDADLRNYLSGLGGREVCYFPNPGNAGDSVIAAATFQQLEHARLDVALPSRAGFDARGKTILYGGGGNLVGPSTHSHRLLRSIHRNAFHLTILPHTIKAVDDLLGEFGPNVTVICRERVSYDHVAGLGGRYETLLMHDMAFGLDARGVLAKPTGYSLPKAVLQMLWARLRKRGNAPGPRALALAHRNRNISIETEVPGVLNAFRVDGESRNFPRPPDNIDLSTVFEFGVAPRPIALHAARSLLAALDAFDTVRTDRLHVAISAALLGKDVRFFPNNYYKCRAVYEFSMKGFYPNVTWMGPTPGQPPSAEGAETRQHRAVEAVAGD